MKYVMFYRDGCIGQLDEKGWAYTLENGEWKRWRGIVPGWKDHPIHPMTDQEAEEMLAKGIDSYWKLARQVAEKAHAGQKDRAGKDYINHLIRVGFTGHTDKSIAVGFLHDILRDTPTTAEDLLDMGFSKDIVEAVQVLTKPEDMDYFEYINEVTKNPLAATVKLWDLGDNMDISRIPNPTEKDKTRREKYLKAHDIIYTTLYFNQV